MKMKKVLFLALFGSLIWSCSSLPKTTAADEIVRFKIIQINDVYEIDAINAGKNGGLARVAHIKDSVKNVEPNTFYFLAGDFLNPSLLGTIKVDNERLQGKQMIEVLNASGLDLVTFGNHEFDLKEADLQKRLNESNFKWTSANVLQITPEGNSPFQIKNQNTTGKVSDYEVFTVKNKTGNEIKFGVFGVTLPSNPVDYVFYGDVYDESVRAYDLASKEADFVLGLTHVSLEEDHEIARRIPTLPLIMGGHEHENMLLKEGNTIIAKADANVLTLFVHTLAYNLSTKELAIDSELVKVDDRVASSPKVQQVVDKWNAILEENLKTVVDNPNEVILTTTEALDGTDNGSRNRQTNLGEIITQSMNYAYGNWGDGVIFNGGGIRVDDVLEGDILSKDIFRVLPFGGSIYQVEMTGELLEEVLNFGVKVAGTGAYLQRHQLTQSPEGKWLVKNEIIDPKKVYHIVLNDYLMMGFDIPFLTPENKGVLKVSTPTAEETAYDIRKAIIHYIQNEM